MNQCIENDLVSRKLGWLLWYVPLALFIVGSFWSRGRVWMWTPAMAAAGSACVVNASRCGRFHCIFTGPLYLLGALATLLSGFGIVPLRWWWISCAMLVGSVLAFIPEWLGRKYVRSD